MAKYNIGVLFGSGIMKFLEETQGLKLFPNTVHDSSAKQLQMGRVDVWAIVDLTGIMYMKKLFPDEADYYKFTKSFNLGDVSVVFSKKMDPDNIYNTKFQEGLATIKKNGILELIETPLTLKDVGGLDAMKEWLKRRATFIVNENKVEYIWAEINSKAQD